MANQEFTIVTRGLSTDGEDWEDRLFEAGCDDALVALQRGLVVLHFDREAPSFAEAVSSACRDVRAAGATVVRVEPDPLVSASDIADRAGVTRQAISLYAKGDRSARFPTPVAGVTGQRPLWKWVEVARWLHEAGKLDERVVEIADAIDRVNSEIADDATEADSATGAVANPAAAGAPDEQAVNEYTRMQFYLRREILEPKLRTAAPRTGRRRSEFNPRRPLSSAPPARASH